MIGNLENFLKTANTLLATLNEYAAVTGRLAEVNLFNDDLEYVLDDIGQIIDEREDLKERVEIAQEAMLASIEKLDGEDGEMVRCTFMNEQSGETEEVAYSITGDKRLVRDVIFKLLGVQKDILEKDAIVIENLTSRRDEVRGELKNLQEDKKKIDFLNTMQPEQTQSQEFNV
ncbi:MAG: hypothetical protein FWG83_06655 [Oscillospiraceae bacterium]|nr:hypothetical protein [Oscillospiraceae bacterium]